MEINLLILYFILYNNVGINKFNNQRRICMSNCKSEAEIFQMTGYCGINCSDCKCSKAKDDEKLLQFFISKGIPAEKLPCPGCRAVEGNCPVIGEKCETYKCALEKNIDFCYECEDFPCDKLNPAADRANVLPHNLKVFNLCYIKNNGLEKFAENSAMIWEKYYEGKMAIGKGPQLE
jgi:hypothetical protein